MKPAVTGFDSHDLNEHLCLEAARLAGLSAAASHVATFDGERAIVPKLKLAMRVGGGYALGRIGGRHRRRLAGSVGLDEEATVGRVDDLAGRLPAALERAASTDAVREMRSELPERLVEAVTARAKVCRAALG